MSVAPSPDALADLHARAFRRPAPWTAAEIAQLTADRNVHLFVDGAARMPTGFALLRRAADEADLLTLAVSPAHRRRGIARALMSRAIVAMRGFGVRMLFLEVAHDNAAARALYAALGFVQCGRRKGYYRDGDAVVDALVLRLDLSPQDPRQESC